MHLKRNNFLYFLFKTINLTENPCFVNPCENNGYCQRFGSNGYICLCHNDFTGYNCSISKNQTNYDCLQGLCKNEGTCTFSNDVPICTCQNGYSGKLCEFSSKINETNQCIDKETFCKNITNLCNSHAKISGLYSVKEYCPISCGQCSKISNLPNTTISTISTHYVPSCIDKNEFCANLKHLCNSEVTIGGKESIKSYCAFTCQQC